MAFVASKTIPNGCTACGKTIRQGEFVGLTGGTGDRKTYAHSACLGPTAPKSPRKLKPDEIVRSGVSRPTIVSKPTPVDCRGAANEDEDEEGDDAGEEEEKKGESDASDSKGLTPDFDLDDFKKEVVEEVVERLGEKIGDRVNGQIAAKLQTLVAATIANKMPGIEESIKKSVAETGRKSFEEVSERMGEDLKQTIAEVNDLLQQRIDQRLEEVQEVVIRVQPADRDEFVIKGEVFHECFETVLELLVNGFEVFLPGQTGSGKSHLCGQLARVLGCEYAVLAGSAGTTEAELLGYAYPNIKTGQMVYTGTEFVRLYENGGLFLVDEMDAMDANVLLKINAAVANGFLPLPKRADNPVAKRHPQFRLIAAANTWGQGASRTYCGRNRLDESTLDRFRAGTVPVGYSPAIESRLCPDSELLDRFRQWRKRMDATGVQRIISTRFVRDAYRLIYVLKYPLSVVVSRLTGGWSPNEVADVIGNINDL